MFERGLPGYDFWLDNHGNPGIQDGEDMDYPDWAINEQIDVLQIDSNPDRYIITRIATGEFIEVGFGPNSTDRDKVDERTLLINGEYVDLGDDLVEFLSILDEYHDQDGQIGRTIRQNPFEE